MCKRWLIGLVCVVYSTLLVGENAQTNLCIISYNVENLFDAEADSLGRDKEFTPDGERHWGYGKYQNKLQHIAQVITNIGGWQVPALVGLLEVENARCLHDLTRYKMPHHGYRFLHQDSPDARGIDCALLYDARQFQLLDSAFIPIPLEGRATRDILYAKGAVNQGEDTLHVFVCHMPSQLGGASATGVRREKAFAVLQTQIDSLLQQNSRANIVVMGDMNQEQQDNLRGVRNRMLVSSTATNLTMSNNDSTRTTLFSVPYPGTHKYNGIWSFLDQFYTAGYLLEDARVSVFAPDWLLEEDPKFVDKRPIRTYHGFRYQKAGYSDHLPIVLMIPLK